MDPLVPQAGRSPAVFPTSAVEQARRHQAGAAEAPSSEAPSSESPSSERRVGGDQVELSALGRTLAASEERKEGEGPAPALQLSEEEREQVRELQARDREVRAHEQAHKAAAGDLGSGPSYEYERGPDGNRYAVGGEVGIQVREGRTPEETIQLAQRVRRAALAPAEPSGQDRAVAAQAVQMEARARAEAAEEKRESSSEGAEGAPGTAEDRLEPRAERGPGSDDDGGDEGAPVAPTIDVLA